MVIWSGASLGGSRPFHRGAAPRPIRTATGHSAGTQFPQPRCAIHTIPRATMCDPGGGVPRIRSILYVWDTSQRHNVRPGTGRGGARTRASPELPRPWKTRHWCGRGASYKPLLMWGGAGVSRAWRGLVLFPLAPAADADSAAACRSPYLPPPNHKRPGDARDCDFSLRCAT
eukprot:gene15393-biopygen21707